MRTLARKIAAILFIALLIALWTGAFSFIFS